MNSRKHVPVRTCVVCRQQAAKRDLVRIARTPDGIFVDPTGKLKGRGAYLCSDPACWQRAAASSVLEKALRTDLSDADRDRLRAAQP